MNVLQRPYANDADLPAILELKQQCTTAQNLYDRPTVSDLRHLLAPLPEPRISGTLSREEAWREMTRQLTALWENASGQLVAYALIAQPGNSLTFQVHPQAQGLGLEAEILAWGLAQMQTIAQACGVPRELWCRCHESEQERRSVLEATRFRPPFEPDLRLVHPLATPLPAVSLPHGFSLKRGVTQIELDAYQELHQRPPHNMVALP